MHNIDHVTYTERGIYVLDEYAILLFIRYIQLQFGNVVTTHTCKICRGLSYFRSTSNIRMLRNTETDSFASDAYVTAGAGER